MRLEVGDLCLPYIYSVIGPVHLTLEEIAVTKRIKWIDVIPYIISQILGATTAAMVLLVWWGGVITRIDPPTFLVC